MLLVDSHSHIFAEDFDYDREVVLDRAAQAGVKYHVLPNIDSTSVPRLLETADRYSQCFPLMGLHPTSVNRNFSKELEVVGSYLSIRKFWGIGEIGIDLYWDKTFVEEQKVAFRHQVQLAKKLGLPVAIHARNSFQEIFSILDEEADSTLSGVFHSFTGTLEDYRHILDYQTFMVGIGGVVTFKNGGVDRVLPHINIEKIVLETDSPYLSPAPARGKRNESFNLTFIAQRVAGILEMPVHEVASLTSANAIELFNLPINNEES
ncbi:MAG TPA: TatD family hydrolase [Tenuifilaceae bacterium]|nr:TatD family hydrolase [Tenuifilaceae bacterium]